MPSPGDVVLCNYQGAQGKKWRPSVVVSSAIFHANSLDVIVGELTTQVVKANLPTNCLLQDWVAAGLHQASLFRVYFSMALEKKVFPIGRLTDRDWLEVQNRLRIGLAVT